MIEKAESKYLKKKSSRDTSSRVIENTVLFSWKPFDSYFHSALCFGMVCS